MSEHEYKIGDGKSPEGIVVSYWEVERPGSVGAKGSQDYLIEVRNTDGNRLTHSDSLVGLKKAGFTVIEPAVDEPVPVETLAPAPEKSVEEELGV